MTHIAEDIAAWCDCHAREKRHSAAKCGYQKKQALLAEASAYENVARVLRNMQLDSREPPRYGRVAEALMSGQEVSGEDLIAAWREKERVG